MTKAVFDALSDDQAFELCHPGLSSTKKEDSKNFDINQMPYVLCFSKRSKYGTCKYSGAYNCPGCMVPFDTEMTVNDCLKLNELTTNDTLFDESQYKRGREFSLRITWHKLIDQGLFSYLSNSSVFKEKANVEPQEQGQKPDEADQTPVVQKRVPKSDITLADCFNEFKVTETLDEDNKWYCNRCKDFV